MGSGTPTEWSDDKAKLRLESFSDGTLKGTFSSELMRPNKPAEPFKLEGGKLELNVIVR